MSTEQEQWAAQIREIPSVFRMALLPSDDHTIRHRPAASEWSAVEVVGHMIDKMQIWASRVECILVEEQPALPGYDQDALVRDHDYLHADPEVVCEHLRQVCERFATLVEHIPISLREIEPCSIRYQSPWDRRSTDYQPVSRRKKGDLLCQYR
jgi:DinB family protein